MRISDWSSDVCSSDLRRRPGGAGPGEAAGAVEDRAAEDHGGGLRGADLREHAAVGVEVEPRPRGRGEGLPEPQPAGDGAGRVQVALRLPEARSGWWVPEPGARAPPDRKSTRLNSSH